tara:strand:+ start:5078 stop:5527 length:450 start_codon:yes stop_codon:yes gene_type:complete
MPNWCHNRVSFYSQNEKEIETLYNIFTSETPFNQIVPSPDWKNTPNDEGELPILEEMKNKSGEVFYRTYNFPDGKNDDRWYDWQINNWGTKWEISDVDCEDFDGESFECEFDTAWSPAEGIFHAIREKFPNVDVSWFYDEPGMQVAGYL